MANDLIKKIHSVISEKSLLKHPFYEAWNCGELPIESMRKYAEQYYHFEKAYPRFLSNVHSRCDDRNVRQLLLENLWDEEHGDYNHRAMWLDRDLDIQHSDAEAEMIYSLATTEREENDAVDSADIAASSLWNFLDGVYK